MRALCEMCGAEADRILTTTKSTRKVCAVCSDAWFSEVFASHPTPIIVSALAAGGDHEAQELPGTPPA